MPEHVVLKRIGDPPAHLRYWLVWSYVTLEKEARKTRLPWRRIRLEGRAAGLRQALEWLDEAQVDDDG